MYKDPNATIEARVDDLVRRMTLDEKVAQLVTLWNTKKDVLDGLRFDSTKASATYPQGIGQIARPSDRMGTAAVSEGPGGGTGDRWRTLEDTVAFINEVQRWALEHTRLGIPVLFHEESLHGYMAKPATMFPQAIGAGEQLRPGSDACSQRSDRARGSRAWRAARALAGGRRRSRPALGPHRGNLRRGSLPRRQNWASPRCRGLQGDGRALGPGHVFATLKHMTGHGQPESGINVGPAPIAERTLREILPPPFEEIVRRAHAAAVMPSYNEIDGVPSHANQWLLQDVLRGEWGFKGAVAQRLHRASRSWRHCMPSCPT